MPAMPRQQAFTVRTLSIYNSMVKRFAERRNKRGRIIRVGRVVPFSLPEFRAWVLRQLGGDPNGTVSCRYCHKIMSAMDVNFDHPEPVSQGGSLDLGNLDCCCEVCNKLKNSLTERTFRWLLEAMEYAGCGENAMTELDRKDLLSRLKQGGMVYRGPKGPKAKKEPQPETSGFLVEV